MSLYHRGRAAEVRSRRCLQKTGQATKRGGTVCRRILLAALAGRVVETPGPVCHLTGAMQNEILRLWAPEEVNNYQLRSESST